MIRFLVPHGGDLQPVRLHRRHLAKSFEQLQFIPMLIISRSHFLGGAFYSIDMLPPAWRTITLFNPVVYLISGFRWSSRIIRRECRNQLSMTLGFFAFVSPSSLDVQDRISVKN